MKIIGKYYMDSANYSIKDNDFPGLVQNYESLLRNEELRYVKLRGFYRFNGFSPFFS